MISAIRKIWSGKSRTLTVQLMALCVLLLAGTTLFAQDNNSNQSVPAELPRREPDAFMPTPDGSANSPARNDTRNGAIGLSTRDLPTAVQASVSNNLVAARYLLHSHSESTRLKKSSGNQLEMIEPGPPLPANNGSLPPSASKQEMSALQTEVWLTVEAYTEASHQRNLEKYLSFWHPDFLGWHNGDKKPTDYQMRANGLQRYFDSTKSLEYELEPLGIQIIADDKAAIVHYKLRNTLESKATGNKDAGVAYWTDYLVKENDRWLLISDHGGNVTEEKAMSQKEKPTRIDYIEFPIVDIAAAKQFYGKVFGWEFVDYGSDYVSFSDGRLSGGFRKEPSAQSGGPLVVFYTTALESVQAKVEDAGGRIVKAIFDFPGGRRFHFTDPSGNELAVWSDQQ